MHLKLILAVALAFSSSLSFAGTLEKLFEDNFFTLHVPNRCGQNIMNFLKLAEKENFDLSGAEIINVEGGWVEPQYVRNEGYAPKVPGPAGLVHKPGRKYFYFHIFLIHDGKVYDFDYGNTPVVPSIKTYFKKMWLSGRGSDKGLGLRVYKAKDYLSGKPMPRNTPMLNLVKFAEERGR